MEGSRRGHFGLNGEACPFLFLILTQGSIELGVVNQSFSAFNHILNDLSLVVSRFESLSEFTAGIDRLGELTEFLEKKRSGELSVEGGDEAGEAVDTIQLNFSASASVDIKGKHQFSGMEREDAIDRTQVRA